MKSRHGYKVHIVKTEFAKFGNLRLYEQIYLVRVKSAREVVESDLYYVLPYLFGVFGVVGESLRVGYHNVHIVEIAAVLQFYSLRERADVMPDVKSARRTVAR